METLLASLEKESPLVVLWGSGGVGKTTIAAETGRRWKAADEQRRVIRLEVERLPKLTYSILLAEISVQCGCGPLRGDILRREQTLRAELTWPSTLIIVDGIEQVALGERDEWLRFLENVPSSVLVTSRELIPVLRNISIDPMNRPEAKEFLKRLLQQIGNPAVFTTAYRRQVLKASEGNPQILEWLVGQASLGLSRVRILTELRRGKGDAANRVFGMSFDLPQLQGDGQATLLALSLFATDASRGALAEVAGFDGDLSRLDVAVSRLSALRLISSYRNGHRLAVQGLTREMARARLLDDHRRVRIQRRFVAYFLRIVLER